jgi:hypothetical protein
VLLEGIPEGTLIEKDKNLILGQAYFLRAWHYYKLLEMHGGMPIVDKVQQLEDDLFVKRNSSLECFDFVIKDLDIAASLLPVKNTGKNYGRIDQCIVAAFKGKVLLLKASPRFNPTKPYSNSYLTEAYEATKAAKDLLNKNGYELISDYTDVFETKRHKEAVLAILFEDPARVGSRNDCSVRPLSESNGATGGDQPIWNFVKAFTMKDGKKIGESDKYIYNDQTFWENRDPRFDATIVWNASIYELSGKTGRRQYTTPNIAASSDAFGTSIVGEHHPRSGFYCRKGMTEELPVALVQQDDRDWLEIRFAEVLFNYAEMANEKGEISEAYEVLKAIRERAGIEVGSDGLYGLKAGMTKAEMRMALLDEKRIEFSFEGKRFWDISRHRLFTSSLHGITKLGCLATLKEGIDFDDAEAEAKAYTLHSNAFSYSFPDIELMYNKNAENIMHRPDEQYFFPISKSEIEKNPNLEQTEGWGGSFKCELP